MDTLRLKSSRWCWLLIGAAVSVVLGVIAVTRPSFVLNGIAVFIGISLIIEAVMDLILLVLIRRQEKSEA